MKNNLRLLFFISFLFSTVNKSQPSKWLTKFEKTNFQETETYSETIDYFRKLADASPFAKLIKIGRTSQGRFLYCFIYNRKKHFDSAEVKKDGSAVILIQNGIHAGEIEGKDASMLLLRDLIISPKTENIANNVTLLIIPVFNADGHERRSPYNRINQNGPKEMGWRTTALNLNLNRDYTKADTPEMKAWLKLYNKWLPDFFVDTHTTDGADYQYVITYDIDVHSLKYPPTVKWIKKSFEPFIKRYVNKKGFLIFPYVSFVKGNLKNGVKEWIPSPRFSNGYTLLHNRPGLLIETHMLKPYKQRVFATKALLKAIITRVNKDYKTVVNNNIKADKYVINYFVKENHAYPLRFKLLNKADTVLYLGKKTKIYFSKIFNSNVKFYSKEKQNLKIPYYHYVKVSDSVFLPEAYLIPKEYSFIAQKLKLHGIVFHKLELNKKAIVEHIIFKNVKFPNHPYEGRFSPSYDYDILKDTVILKKGDFIVPTNQKALGLLAFLLEPKSIDSFLKWGLFNPIFERKEYFEVYSMLPIAERMYELDSKLRKEYNDWLKNRRKPSFRQKLNFFYRHSKYFDSHYNHYPVLRVLKYL